VTKTKFAPPPSFVANGGGNPGVAGESKSTTRVHRRAGIRRRTWSELLSGGRFRDKGSKWDSESERDPSE
jgi:hypothetical protein